MPCQPQDAPPEVPESIDSRTARLAELIHELSLCHRLMRQALAELVQPWGVTDTEFLVLWVCDQGGEAGVGQNDLAHAVGVSTAQMSGMVDRLRRRNFLVARRCDQDRRRQFWQLAEAAQPMLQQIRTSLIQSSERLAREPSAPDQSLLISLLRKLSQVVEQQANLLAFPLVPLTIDPIYPEARDAC